MTYCFVYQWKIARGEIPEFIGHWQELTREALQAGLQSAELFQSETGVVAISKWSSMEMRNIWRDATKNHPSRVRYASTHSETTIELVLLGQVP